METKIKKVYIIMIIFIAVFEVKTVAGYTKMINLKVTAEIAQPIFIVQNDETISGNYSDIINIPEYNFAIKNFNDENKISEITLSTKINVISENKIEFEIVDCSTNEVVLSNNKNSYQLIMEKDKACLNEYRVIIKNNLVVVRDHLKIEIDGKYYKKELDVFDINIDKRDLEYQIFVSDIDKKYTNNDITVQIKCNKEIKEVSGFKLSADKTCLTKVYNTNHQEEVTVEDYFNKKKNIQISINNIDKTMPEITGIEEGKNYDVGLKLIYKDNVGIRSIKIENTSNKESYSTIFDTQSKVIDNQSMVVKNNSINPYYLTKTGNYTITVTDFAENQIIRHISIK